MNRIAKAYHLVSTLGPRWVWFRICYAALRRSGALVRRAKPGEWTGVAIGHAPESVRWFHPIENIGHGAQQVAEAVLRGQFRLFSYHAIDAGVLPAWAQNPLTGREAPAAQHWSTLDDFAFGDIKGIWELNRFPWAFALGRAYSATCDDRYPEGFWRLFEDWLGGNLPNCGPNWMCGQEATFRLIAVLWTSDVVCDSRASTSERWMQRDVFVVQTARRIAANLDYALSQSNNHGVSECVGLITAALRLPKEPEAVTWAERGWHELKRQLAELVYPDGGFSQHSAVYHRVLLHDLLWLISILQRSDAAVPAWLTGTAERALAFLDALITPETGRVPLYGPNDGANILPLSDGDFLDFRPLIQAGHAVLHGVRRFPPGPWDEAARWLAVSGLPPEVSVQNSLEIVEQEQPKGTERGQTRIENRRRTEGSLASATDIEEPRTNHSSAGASHFPDAGVLLWRRGETRVFFRCPTRFCHRPAQADLLHVDVEWRGVPIAHDAGTFSYNTAGVFSGGLKEAAVHNTVTFDGAEPLQKVSRFLYLPWPKGRAKWEGDEFLADHDGWSRIGVQHDRRVAWKGQDEVVVIDRMRSGDRHRARVHWLLVDLPHELRPGAGELVLQTELGAYRLLWHGTATKVELVRADSASVRGWWSPYYGHAAPALSLTIEFDFSGEVEFVTRFEPVRANDKQRTTDHR